jgi:hypothetical protein
MPMTSSWTSPRKDQRSRPAPKIGLTRQREQPEIVLVQAVPLGRHGAAIAGVAEVVGPRRADVRPLGELPHLGGNVVEHPVHEAVAVGQHERRIRIVADRARARACPPVRPLKAKAGETSSPSPVCFAGMAPPAAKAGEVSCMADGAKPMFGSFCVVTSARCASARDGGAAADPGGDARAGHGVIGAEARQHAEATVLQQPHRVAGEVTAARERTPERVHAALPALHRRIGREAVLGEEQAAARA